MKIIPHQNRKFYIFADVSHTHICRGINSCQLQVAVRLDRGSFLRYSRDCRGSSYSTMTVSRICKHSLMRTKQASPDVQP